MRSLQKNISFALGVFVLLITLGIPVYQVHCSCSGDTQMSVIVTPDVCANQHNHCCESESQHTESNCDLLSHHCDDVKTNIILFNELQNITSPLAIVKPFLSPIIIALLPVLSIRQQLLNIDKPQISNRETPPVKLLTTSSFLSIICQRKIPACA